MQINSLIYKYIFTIIFFSNILFAKNVLIINSYSSTFEWTKQQSDAIIKTLKSDKDVSIFVEFMDTKVFKPTQSNQNNFLNFYKNKYKNISFNAIVTTDDNALNFVRKYKNEQIFKDINVFFSGVNNLSLAKELSKEIYTGVFEEKNPVANFDIAQDIMKNLKTVYLVGDDSVTANKEIILYKSHYSQYKYINFEYLNSKNIEDIINKLYYYKEDSVMMLLVFTGFTKDNKHIGYKKVLKQLSHIYNNPMLIHTNVYIDIPDTNIIGGDCTDGKTAGEITAKKVLKYLSGTPMKELKFDFNKGNKVYINVKNLNRLGVNVDDVDVENPILINKENSFYDMYQRWINLSIVIVVLSIIFMIILTKKNKNLKKHTRKIRALNDSLELKVKHALKKLDKQHRKHKEDTIKNTKFSVIGQMAAGITHEINTPLTYIKGTTEMARFDLEDMPPSDYKQRLLDDNKLVMDGVNRMSMIVESMREMSQVTPAQREVCNVYDTLITALRIIYNRAKLTSRIYVNDELFNLDTSLKDRYKFTASINKQRIEQVWTIILNNALDELVKIENFENRKIDIFIFEKNDNVSVMIQDNAGGVSEDIKDKIFEPFVSTKVSSGIGIGLNVAKKIIDEHGATIEIENKNGGACFTVSGI